MKIKGFTLTEVLIAMAIMAVIAIFTIPKVVNSVKNSDSENWRRTVKQVVGEVEAAYSQYRLNNRTVPTTFRLTHASPYFNYVKEDTTTVIDGTPCEGTLNCSNSSFTCYKMKNSSILYIKNTYFDGTATTNGINFKIDPDGKVTGAGSHDGKSVNLYLYYNGRIKSRSQIDPNTTDSSGSVGPVGCDPNWFNWN